MGLYKGYYGHGRLSKDSQMSPKNLVTVWKSGAAVKTVLPLAREAYFHNLSVRKKAFSDIALPVPALGAILGLKMAPRGAPEAPKAVPGPVPGPQNKCSQGPRKAPA